MRSFRRFWIQRELSSDRSWLYGLFLTLGVAGLTLVDLFSARVIVTSQRDTQKFMGADYMIRSWREPPATMRADLQKIIAEDQAARLIEQKALLAAGQSPDGTPYSFSLTATEEGFPLYGSLKIENASGVAERPRFEAGKVFLDQSLKARGFKIADRIKIGSKDFSVAGFIVEEPQSTNFIASLGYRAIVLLDDLRGSNLMVPGARVSHRFLIKASLPEDKLRKQFREKHPDKYWRLISVRQGTEQVARLTGILSTVLVFFAVLASLMGSLTTYFLFRIRIRRKLPELLTLKCLGLRQAEILWSNLILFLILAALGVLSGFLLGSLAENFVAKLATDVLGAELSQVRPWFPTLLRVSVVATISVVWSTWIPLREALAVPVNQIFNSESSGSASANPVLKRLQALALAGIGFLYILVFSPEMEKALWTFGALILATLLSLFIAEVFLRSIRVFVGRKSAVKPFLLYRGLLRNPLRTRIILSSLILGTAIVSAAFLLSNSLREQIAVARANRSADLIIMSPDEGNREALTKLSSGAANLSWFSYSQARIYYLDGKPVREVSANPRDNEDADEIGIREYFINYRSVSDPPLAGEEILDSRPLFGESQADLVRVSMERRFAERVGLKLADEFLIELGGIQLRARIDSLRTINWFNFNPNFFVVLAAEDVQGAPQSWIGLFRSMDSSLSVAQVQQQFVTESPQSIVLDTQQIAGRVLEILGKVDATVFWVSVFLMATLLVLVWGIAAGRLVDWPNERFLLRSLGMRIRDQRIVLYGEFVMLWLCALALGLALALILAFAISERLFGFPFWLPGFERFVSAIGVLLALMLTSLLALRSGMKD